MFRFTLPSGALAAGFLGLLAIGQGAPPDPPKKVDVAKGLEILKTSNDGIYIKKIALALIRSGETGVIKQVGDLLGDRNFLDRLHTLLEPDKNETRVALSIWETPLFCLLLTIAEQGTPEAESVLIQLSANPEYAPVPWGRGVGWWYHPQALIGAMGFLKKKPSPKLLEYLEAQGQPRTAFAGLAVMSLLRLRDPEACRVFERILLTTPVEDQGSRRYYLNYLICYARLQRYHPVVIEMYERLMAADIKNKALRDTVVATLFEDRPGWQPVHRHPEDRRPLLKDVPTEVLRRLRTLTDTALKLDIEDDTKEGVRAARRELDMLLAAREKQKK